jgi:hypothetical protein
MHASRNPEQRRGPPSGSRSWKYSQDPDSQLADVCWQIEHHQRKLLGRPGSSRGSKFRFQFRRQNPGARWRVTGAQIPAQRGAKRKSVQAVSLPRTGECLIRRTTLAKAVSSSFFVQAPFIRGQTRPEAPPVTLEPSLKPGSVASSLPHLAARCIAHLLPNPPASPPVSAPPSRQ